MEKPVKRTITVEYWDCGKGHQHKTEKAAANCMAKGTKRPRWRWNYASMKEIVDLRETGMTFKEIGAQYGIGGGYASTLYYQFLRYQKYSKDMWERKDIKPVIKQHWREHLTELGFMEHAERQTDGIES